MRHLKSLFSWAVLAAILSFVTFSEATNYKRPLTPKVYGDQWYYEWSSATPVSFTSNEILTLYADTTTANLYGNDPLYILMSNNRSSNVGPWRSLPGTEFPKDLCVNVVASAQADSSTSAVSVLYSKTRNGTFVAHNTTANVVHTGTTANIDLAVVPLDPNSFWEAQVKITSATDSLYLTRVTVWPCKN